ncbi:hypothetical protein ACSFA3_22505 [Variovorax sp. RHLX14]|uniref:hypothetical protein n=1 Tax=unclassified Variovorax TaxID=663243 RepID=UPI003F474F1C
MNTGTAYSLATLQSQDSSLRADDPAEAFAAALRRADWNEVERQLRAGSGRAGENADAWALRKSDWYLAQQRWYEAETHLKGLFAEGVPAGLFQTIVRHKLGSIAFMRNDDAGCVAWLSPLLEVDGVANALPQGFRTAEILWVRALHRSHATDRLHRWAAQLDALGQLDPQVAGVASLAMWERGDLASAKRWIAMGRRGNGSASAECLVAAAHMAMASRASLAEAGRLVDEACSRWADDGRTWAARGLIKLLTGNMEGANTDLERATRRYTSLRAGLARTRLGADIPWKACCRGTELSVCIASG